MDTYYFKITMTYVPKNKIYESLLKFAQDNDRTLIHGEKQLKNFMKKFYRKVETLHSKHNRCKPIDFHFETDYQYDKTKDWHTRGAQSWTATIYHVKNLAHV